MIKNGLHMIKKKKGAIINIGSICSYYPLPYLATYAATKHFTAAFSQAIAAEYSDRLVIEFIILLNNTFSNNISN